MQKDDEANLRAIYFMFDELSRKNHSYRLNISGAGSHLGVIAGHLNFFADGLENWVEHFSHESDQITIIAPQEPAERLRNYILKQLNQPLPSQHKLSRMFNTNSRKLKQQFRARYQTSIYQYYKKHRLEKIKFVIQNSDRSLAEIADEYGFQSYSSFSLVFKGYHGYAPSLLRKNK